MPITNVQDKADVFNKYFSSVGVADNGVMPCCKSVTLRTVLCDTEIRAADVIPSIDRLKTNSSCGPDGLTPVLSQASQTLS